MVHERFLRFLLTVVFACISIVGFDIALDNDISFPPFELPEACACISVSVLDEGLSSKQHEQQDPIARFLLISLFRLYSPSLIASTTPMKMMKIYRII
jgi:hypothetical protein